MPEKTYKVKNFDYFDYFLNSFFFKLNNILLIPMFFIMKLFIMLISVFFLSTVSFAENGEKEKALTGTLTVEQMKLLEESVKSPAIDDSYFDKIMSENINDLIKRDSSLGPTTICKDGHRWICVENFFKDDEFRTILSGYCTIPEPDRTCFQVY